jgi:hypothetical protein
MWTSLCNGSDKPTPDFHSHKNTSLLTIAVRTDELRKIKEIFTQGSRHPGRMDELEEYSENTTVSKTLRDSRSH